MTQAIATQPDDINPAYLRLETTDVPATQGGLGECGFTTYARTLAQALQTTLHGSTWHAATRIRMNPHPRIDGIADVIAVIDHRHLISVAQRTPAGTTRDTWTIRYDGRPIPHRTFPGEVPHQIPTITRSIWRHLHGVTLEPCDTLGCTALAVVAAYRHISLCTRCGRRYTNPDQ